MMTKGSKMHTKIIRKHLINVDCGVDKMTNDDVMKWKHFPRYWPFVRGTIGHWWIPLTKASDAELWYFLWSASEHVTVMQHFVWSRANWLSQTQLIVDGRRLPVATERFIKVHTKNVSWIIPPGWIYANTFNKWRKLISPQIVSKRASQHTLNGSAMNINDSDNMKWKHILKQQAWVKEITLQTSPFPDQQIKHKLW